MQQEEGFWDSLASSFNKTFIRENRWKLFLEGVGTTISPGQKLPAAIRGACQPPLKIRIFRIQIPSRFIRRLNRRMEIADEFHRLNIFLSFIQAVHPGDVFFRIAFIPSIAQGM